MGFGVIGGDEGSQEGAVLFDSTTGWCFGPVFDTVDHAEDFLAWFDKRGWERSDPRRLTLCQLSVEFDEWRKERVTEAGDLKEDET